MEKKQTTAAGNPLGTAPIGGLIMKFSIPAVISMVVNAIYNIVDQIFIGRGIGMLGMAATNVAFPLTTISTAVALLIGIGSASNFSLMLGRKQTKDASYIIGNAMVYFALAGLVMAAICLAALTPLLRAFGATDQIMPFAEPYTLIIILGIPFAIFSTGASHIIRADGSPRYAMVCVLAGAVFNLIFDPIFIFVFDWGISGIAWATTLGQVLSSAIALRYILRSFHSVPLTAQHLKLQPRYLRTIASLGASSFFNHIAMTAMQITMNNTIRHYGALSEYGSEIPLAVVGAISKIGMLFMGLCIGVAQGCQPIHGYNYGAKNFDRVKETYKKSAIIVSIISIIAFACFQLFPRQIIGIFGDGTEEYMRFGTQYLRVYMFMSFANGIQPLTGNFFTSIGKAMRGLFISMTRQVLFLIPLILLLPMVLGLDGIVYAGPIADSIALILAIVFVGYEMRIMGKESLPTQG